MGGGEAKGMAAVSVIMPCHNRASGLLKILEAYERQEGSVPFEIIAIDDGSTDGTYELLSRYEPTRFSLRVKRLESSRGPAVARNEGIALARSPIILFVGDDIFPTPSLVQGHWEAHRIYKAPQFAILGRIAWPSDMPVNALMKHIDGVGAQQFSYYYLKNGHEYDFRHFYTANISVKREFLLGLNHWFDPSFPYAAFEDTELAFRLAQRGLRILYLESLLVYHYHYHTVWTFSRRQYKSGVSAWLFIKKHPCVIRRLLSARHLIALTLALFTWRDNVQPWRTKALEELLFRLAGAYEWDFSPAADAFFLLFLDYFYFKGVVDAIQRDIIFKNRALRIYIKIGLKRGLKHLLSIEHRPEKVGLVEMLLKRVI